MNSIGVLPVSAFIKTMKQIFTIILIIITQLSVYAQSDYQLMFKNTVTEIENNYAGFDDKIKGKKFIYNHLKKDLLSKKIDNRRVLEKTLNTYLKFFNDDHVYVWSSEIERTKYYQKRGNTPVFNIIDSVAYLAIPSFNKKFKEQIDSLIQANYSRITNIENLIIDVRGNGGGQDPSFHSLIPLIYTNTIFTQNLEFYVTKANRTQRLDSTFQDKNEDKFVRLFGEDEFIAVFDSIPIVTYPKNVGVIIDSIVGSTTEQFLLYAKQSRKVKLFGDNTSGSIDYSNLRYLELIEDSLYVSIPMTRSLRLPENRIDECGIQPDFYIKKSGDNAINEVIEIMNKWK